MTSFSQAGTFTVASDGVRNTGVYGNDVAALSVGKLGEFTTALGSNTVPAASVYGLVAVEM